MFILTNWRVLFYLFFADTSVEARIEHYNTNMHLWRNTLGPIIQGICLAIVMPDIKTLGAKIARRPNRELHDLQKDEAHSRGIAAIERDSEVEEARKNYEALRDSRILAAGEAREKARSFENEDIRQEVEEELSSARKSGESEAVGILAALSEEARELLSVGSEQGHINYLKFLGGEQISAGKLGFESRGMERRKWAKYVSSIEELVTASLLRPVGEKGQMFEITAKGYDVAELINAGEV